MSETPRTFITDDSIDINSGIISITNKDEIHHLVNVVRIKISDKIIALNGNNKEYDAEVVDMSKSFLTLKIKSLKELKQYPSFNLTLIQGITKGDKQDFIIQKSTELGVNSIINVITDRSNVIFKDKIDLTKKQNRWQKVALNASKQSKRVTIPSVTIIKGLKTFLDSEEIDLNNDTVIACVENNQLTSIKTFLKTLNHKKSNTYVLLGPEGGWSQSELELFTTYKINQVHLGQNILRSETASIIAIGIVLYELEL